MLFPNLFSPGAIGSVRLKNRVLHAPMVRNYADANGRVTPRYVAHIREIARGGAGAIILEASYVAPEGKGFANQLGVHTDGVVPGLRALVRTAHRAGAKIGIQLFHGGRQASRAVSGYQPLAPSAIPDPLVGELPRALRIAEIHQITQAFGLAARRAKRVGFDFVELHGAHGYLIAQFLSPFSNRRTDRYGGSPRNRRRFLDEVYDAVRSEVGSAFPITVRVSGDEYVPGGVTIDDTIATARHLQSRGVAAIHVSAGTYASFEKGIMISPMALPDAPLIPLAAAVRHAVSIPVIAVDKIRTPAIAERILREGIADFIALGRPLLADPQWPRKANEGRESEITPCLACNQECIGRLFAQRDVACTVNPAAGREREFARPIGRSLRVLVVGGGAAGMQAARVAAARGHVVTLRERTRRLGGQLIPASRTPLRDDWLSAARSLARDVSRLGVHVELGTRVTAATVKRGEFDVAILAMGSSVVTPPRKGGATPRVITGRALLEGREAATGRVVIAGGGCMGAQTADYLAARGHTVTIVEASPSVAADAPLDDRSLLLGRLAAKKVRVLTDTRLMQYAPHSVLVQSHGQARSIRADTVVLCLGAVPNDGLERSLATRVPRVIVVGDAREPRRVPDAIREGAQAALML